MKSRILLRRTSIEKVVLHYENEEMRNPQAIFDPVGSAATALEGLGGLATYLASLDMPFAHVVASGSVLDKQTNARTRSGFESNATGHYFLGTALPNVSSIAGTMSAGLTLYQACSIRACSLTRNADLMIPMYLLPYIDFSPQAP